MFPGEDELRGCGSAHFNWGHEGEGPEVGVACGIQDMRVVMQSVSCEHENMKVSHHSYNIILLYMTVQPCYRSFQALIMRHPRLISAKICNY